jgi:hypothetical protein
VRGEVGPDPIADREAVDPGTDWPGADPRLDFQSVGFTPETTILTRTSPAAGSGSSDSTSWRTDGSPVCV